MNMTLEEQETFRKFIVPRKQLSEAKVSAEHNQKNNPNSVITASTYLAG